MRRRFLADRRRTFSLSFSFGSSLLSDDYGHERSSLPGATSLRLALQSPLVDPAQLGAPHLSRDRKRDLVDELDRARVLVGGEPFAHEALDLRRELLARRDSVGKLDECLHRLA